MILIIHTTGFIFSVYLIKGIFASLVHSKVLSFAFIFKKCLGGYTLKLYKFLFFIIYLFVSFIYLYQCGSLILNLIVRLMIYYYYIFSFKLPYIWPVGTFSC